MSRLPSKFFVRLAIIATVALIFTACNKPKGVLGQKDMVSILVDMHKVDATMEVKGFNYANAGLKKDYYDFVLKKHGITQAQFDSSVVWYSRNPKKFDRIYNQVVTELTDFQKDIEAGKYLSTKAAEMAFNRMNIWEKRTKFILTPDSARTRLKFKIPDRNFMLGDVYVLKFLHRIAPEDSSLKPCIRLQINYADGRVQGIIQKSFNDGVTRRYTFRLAARHAYKIKSISGEFLGSSAFKGKQNALIDSITFEQTYNPAIQDSLLDILRTTDPKHYPTYISTPDSVAEKKLHRNLRSLILRKR